ncbi:hypothetical protein NEOLEDRAFT_1136281 [Neolentinus lepideus HHB14362 ss-1]|uniref:Uncharacterized protein n=1 Tax=Neolentinus lepideus HHB14362 ss-1 TaxID=1314782 RepID=A0A165R9Z0_9AGAM|nr:hypothetical protein NEOLEDRAFT_1136281 [Neolentinus lepideus HHB14362 ss-1]
MTNPGSEPNNQAEYEFQFSCPIEQARSVGISLLNGQPRISCWPMQDLPSQVSTSKAALTFIHRHSSTEPLWALGGEQHQMHNMSNQDMDMDVDEGL